MNERIADLIEEMGLDLTVDPSGTAAILTYRQKHVFLADLSTAEISQTYSLPQNLFGLFAESESEESVGEDETMAFLKRLINWGYLPTSPSERDRKRCEFNLSEIFNWLPYFRRMRKLAKELRASIGEIDFERIANADYSDVG